MSNSEIALTLSLVLVILTHGWGNAQTRTTPTPQRDASQQSITTQEVQPQAPSQANQSQYKQEDFDIEPSPDEAKRFYKQGVKYGQVGLYSEALAAFELAALLKPNYRDAYFGLGDTYFDMGRWSEARRAFRRVIQLDPKDNKAYARLREINARLAREEKAPKTSVVENNTPTGDRVSLESSSKSNAASRTRPKYATKISDPTQKNAAPSLSKQPASQPAKMTAPRDSSNPTAMRPAQSLTSANSQPARPPTSNPTVPGSISDKSPANSTPLKGSAAGSVASTSVSNPKPESSSTKKTPVEPTVAAAPAVSPTPAKNLVPSVTSKKTVETNSSTTTNAGSELANTSPTGKQAEPAESKKSSSAVSERSLLTVLTSIGTLDLSASPGKESILPTSTVPAVNPGSTVESTESSEIANYRLGVGDVLDIRVSDSPLNTPTQFTVSAGGLLDYPVLPQPLKVLGLTTDEVSQQLGNELKRLALSDKKVMVAVSEYNSHTVLISGLVNEHGTKVLRREAIPLYVLLADAQPLPEAGRVTVISREQQITNVDLAAPEATALLIRHGDVVVVKANPKLFFYIGGEVKEPGEKPFRQGLKLTQAILLAGGLTRVSKSIELARDGANGLLELSVYKLTDIYSGRLPDPPIQPGDRITIVP